MKKIFPFFIFSLLLSCKHESKFNLEKDLYQFSEKMENGDTVTITTDLSACMFFGYEIYTFTKQKDTLFVQKYSEMRTFEKKNQTLSKIIYRLKSDDKNSFEHFFRYLSAKNNPSKSHPIVTINYKNKFQTIRFYDADLRDKFEKFDTLAEVVKKIYPNDQFFEETEPPPPPPEK